MAIKDKAVRCIRDELMLSTSGSSQFKINKKCVFKKNMENGEERKQVLHINVFFFLASLKRAGNMQQTKKIPTL